MSRYKLKASHINLIVLANLLDRQDALAAQRLILDVSLSIVAEES